MADARGKLLDLKELARLQQEMKATAVRFSAGLDANRTSVGKDKTGAVSATVDGTGRVRAVTIDELWQDKVEPSGLGRAIVSAVENGQLQQVAAWSASVVESSPSPASTTDDDRPPHDFDFPHRSKEERLAALEQASSLLESLPERLNAFSRAVSELSERTVEAFSPNHRIALRADGGLLTDVRLDVAWLEATEHVEIGRQISSAFERLYARTREAVAEESASDPAVSEIRRIGRDAKALLGFLGLTPR